MNQQLRVGTIKTVFYHELLRAKGRKFQDQVQAHSIDVLLGELEVMVRHTIGM